jgi:hypothetical protein
VIDKLAPKPITASANPTPSVSSFVVLLDCAYDALPVALRHDSPIRVWDLQVPYGLQTFYLNQDAKTESYWPAYQFPSYYKCDVINSGEDLVFGLSIPFTVVFKETHKEKGGLIVGDGTKLTKPRTDSVSIPTLDPHNGKFTFYLWNGTEQFADVVQPETATLQLPSQFSKTTVRLRYPTSDGRPITLSLGPRPDFTALASAPHPPVKISRLSIVRNLVVVTGGLPSKVELYISNSGPQERFSVKEAIAALDPQSFHDREGQNREENKLWLKVMARPTEVLELPKDIETTRATLNAEQYGEDAKGMSLLKQGWHLYFMGHIQADGHGLDYCLYTNTAEPTKATFCVEHNLPF